MASIGVTGLPASGKSFLCKQLSMLEDYFVIDADKMGHELLKKEEVLDFVSKKYDGVVVNGEIVRSKLAKYVFESFEDYHFYNDYISSIMKDEIRDLLKEKQSEYKHVVLDGALIFEWELESLFDIIIFCEADEKERLKKLVYRGNDLKDYKKREAVLLDEYLKIDQSDIVVKNQYKGFESKELKVLLKRIEELSNV